MSTHPNPHGHAGGHGDEPPFDQEIDVKAMTIGGIGLAAMIAVSMLLMWPLSCSLKQHLVAGDRAPSPVAAANERRLPPGPQLQASPEAELKAMRAEERHLLESYDWVDKTGGTVRIPVARALEIIAERGLPKTAAPTGEPAAP